MNKTQLVNIVKEAVEDVYEEKRKQDLKSMITVVNSIVEKVVKEAVSDIKAEMMLVERKSASSSRGKGRSTRQIEDDLLEEMQIRANPNRRAVDNEKISENDLVNSFPNIFGGLE